MKASSKDDPIRLLSHNLDFWVPPVTEVIQPGCREDRAIAAFSVAARRKESG
jgi:hypothetical protein